MPLIEDSSRPSSMAVASRCTTAPIAAIPAIGAYRPRFVRTEPLIGRFAEHLRATLTWDSVPIDRCSVEGPLSETPSESEVTRPSSGRWHGVDVGLDLLECRETMGAAEPADTA
jgi:hypothetical protein